MSIPTCTFAMRLQLRISRNSEPVPFDHIPWLLGVLHKWLGPDNPEHDAMSLYSMGWLMGAQAHDGALNFPRGATWTLGFYGMDPTRRLTEGILNDPLLFRGMRVLDVQKQTPPFFASVRTFRVASPVIARRHREDRSQEYLLWNDERADTALTNVLQAKLAAAGFRGEHLNTTVHFDHSYRKGYPKLVAIKGIKHKGSMCPVVISGTPEALAFAWSVGVGELTGSGFGALR